jgi:GxxExxY protein
MHTTINDISQAIIEAAIEVHRTLGPGLLESAYEQCLAHELGARHIPFDRQKPLPVDYKGVRLDCGYRLDFLVAGTVVVEVKAIEALLPIHKAQMLSYLKLGGWEARIANQFSCSASARRHPACRAWIRRTALGAHCRKYLGTQKNLSSLRLCGKFSLVAAMPRWVTRLLLLVFLRRF